ncbi:hypothetical protein [Acinetobacter bouvetii]|nr:hypothetical protein [Acinetobacter bouvetii]
MQHYPPKSLAILKTILTSFSVATNLKDLPFFLMSKIIYTKENYILLNIDNFVLHFSIAHEKPPKTRSGTINWDVISRLQLINIGEQNAD